MADIWRLLPPQDPLTGNWFIVREDGYCLAEVYAESDAKMMVSAKQMAKVLKEVREFMVSLPIDTLPNGTFNGVEAALDAAGVKYE